MADPVASLATRPVPVRRRALVRGSAEARRPHSLLHLRTRLPSLGSSNFAPPEAPSLHQPGGHTGGRDRRGETLCLPAWPTRRAEIFSQAAIFFDGQTTPPSLII
ncbi:hypothetical protein NDU88_003282 [Pleurodeles waltl]|uniref:Uncharacterized protein n=1 Tax=Pleurodeles waltl TaxID=8319 RepID=A0AAV7LF83_PLEWA|nr:hypothetical protein NDU88_003282 [Pleurodeles waltl]